VDQLAELVTVIATIIAACSAVYAAWTARKARVAAEKGREGVIEVDGKLYSLGKQIDGRLSELLAGKDRESVAAVRLAHAEGVASGEQSQRDRSAEAQP
jgi:hypothetical protein